MIPLMAVWIRRYEFNGTPREQKKTFSPTINFVEKYLKDFTFGNHEENELTLEVSYMNLIYHNSNMKSSLSTVNCYY